MGYFDVVVDIKSEELCGILLVFKHDSRLFDVDEELN
jgi:hypothetical protein